MKITSGSFEVLDTGVVISFGLEPLTFFIANNFKVTIKFIDDKVQAESIINYDSGGPDELVIELINFNTAYDVGNSVPILIGAYNDRKLYLNFRTRTLSINSNRTFVYTWYLGVKDGDAINEGEING